MFLCDCYAVLGGCYVADYKAKTNKPTLKSLWYSGFSDFLSILLHISHVMFDLANTKLNALNARQYKSFSFRILQFRFSKVLLKTGQRQMSVADVRQCQSVHLKLTFTFHPHLISTYERSRVWRFCRGSAESFQRSPHHFIDRHAENHMQAKQNTFWWKIQ